MEIYTNTFKVTEIAPEILKNKISDVLGIFAFNILEFTENTIIHGSKLLWNCDDTTIIVYIFKSLKQTRVSISGYNGIQISNFISNFPFKEIKN